MAAIEKDLYVEQGTDWEFRFLLRDDTRNIINLTSYTGQMQVRSTVDSAVVLLTLSTATSGMTITAATGEVKLTIANATSTAFTFTEAVYDLELTDSNAKVFRLAEGNFYISKQVTR